MRVCVLYLELVKFRARFSVKVIGQAMVLAMAGINIRVMFATGIMVSFVIRV